MNTRLYSHVSYLMALTGSMMWAVCSGCGSGLDIVPVRGKVQIDGAPMTEGKVLFSSIDRHKPAVGTIQPDGTFVLSTLKSGDGAVPGRFRVTVMTDLKIRDQEIRATFLPPKGYLLTVEGGQENHFAIDVSQASGWKKVLDD